MKGKKPIHWERLRRWYANLSLRTTVVLTLVVLVLMPVLLISLITNSLGRDIIHRKTTLYAVDILTEVGHTIERRVREADSVTAYISANETIQDRLHDLNMLPSADDNGFVVLRRKLVDELLNLTISNDAMKRVVIITRAGREINSSQMDPNKVQYTPEDLDLLLAQKGSLVWLPRIQDGASHIAIGRVINDLGTQRPIGYMLAEFDVKVLTGILTAKEYFEEGSLYIVDGKNRIIAANREELVGQPFRHGGYVTKNVDSLYISRSEGYLTYYRLPGVTWMLVSEVSSINYEQEIWTLRNYTIAIALGTLLLTSLIALRFAQSLLRPIIELYAEMREVGEGNFDVRKPVREKNEIGMLYEYFYSMVDRVQYLIRETNQQQLLLQKAELNSLRMQINPHFIYNTLESIKWMAQLQGNQDIVVMVKAFGDFMRSSISGREFVPLSSELANVNNYLTVQKYRYGNRLQVHTRVESDTLGVEIPKFILQPLIENAIVHGLENKVSAGLIEIEAHLQGGFLRITVADNGIGFLPSVLDGMDLDQTPELKDSIGLRNVHQRIHMYYGEGSGLSIESDYGIGSTVTVVVPATGKP
uniref:Putative histidine kinase n=1 Tax=termite gut metagenome TaxID=433724 RepID=S0DDU1_9ZZZZ